MEHKRLEEPTGGVASAPNNTSSGDDQKYYKLALIVLVVDGLLFFAILAAFSASGTSSTFSALFWLVLILLLGHGALLAISHRNAQQLHRARKSSAATAELDDVVIDEQPHTDVATNRELNAKCKELQAEVDALAAEGKLTEARLASVREEFKATVQRHKEKELQLKENMTALQHEIGRLTGNSEAIKDMVSSAQAELDSLRPFVGLRIENARADQRGVLVKKVLDGTPAQSFGLLKGDIIESLDGEDAVNSVDVMTNIANRHPGDLVSFQVNRHGSMMNIILEIGSKEISREELFKLRRRASGLLSPSDIESHDFTLVNSDSLDSGPDATEQKTV